VRDLYERQTRRVVMRYHQPRTANGSADLSEFGVNRPWIEHPMCEMYQELTRPTPPEVTVAGPLSEALLAFARNDYVACIEWLQRVRRIAHRCGGSLAQCDVIHLTLAEAALRARKPDLAGALMAERTARKLASRPQSMAAVA
jgi:hypothetical protein